MWVIEDQFHPLWGIPNLGGLDCHHYIVDWLHRALVGGKPTMGGVVMGEWRRCRLGM